VGTVTEIYDYLPCCFARAGTPRCPDHGIDLTAQTVSQMVDQVLEASGGHRPVALVAPLISDRKGEHGQVFEDLSRQGFVRVRIDGRIHELDARPELDPKRKHSIEAVVDRLKVRPDIGSRLAESFETALRLSGGLAHLIYLPGSATRRATGGVLQPPCSRCAATACRLEPKLFFVQQPGRRRSGCDDWRETVFLTPG